MGVYGCVCVCWCIVCVRQNSHHHNDLLQFGSMSSVLLRTLWKVHEGMCGVMWNVVIILFNEFWHFSSSSSFAWHSFTAVFYRIISKRIEMCCELLLVVLFGWLFMPLFLCGCVWVCLYTNTCIDVTVCSCVFFFSYFAAVWLVIILLCFIYIHNIFWVVHAII